MYEPSDDFTADRLQAALTRRFLEPVLPVLEAVFLEVRAETDAALADQTSAAYGKPYPYGYCLEITMDVMRRLNARISRPRTAGDRALKAFIAHGGAARRVWGVLRESYFQNAIQLGSLYVDVSNDTVDVRKPKVEILPMRTSGLIKIRDAEHFARIGSKYWNLDIYANIALPTLAPAFPMIGVSSDGRVQMLAKLDYMVRFFARDDFAQARFWLSVGPSPPDAVVRAVRERCPPDLLAANPETGVAAGVAACDRLPAKAIDAWLPDMVAAFDRTPVGVLAESPPRSVGIADPSRINARLSVGIGGVAA